ncbi:hypothetical protein [Ahrensia sp. 13_GOM-1096m]|uniref:hypothetical protein n=1 Tax=Ahrensia sp. 13_GOM-1096m TaxID=1380380 RepID=UPI0005522C8F|nr:hypothetical protein [Ahrensia sp. 13_GOM-1096m]
MNQLLSNFNEMNDEEYTAIGRCARTFGALEHELLRTLIDYYGGPLEAKDKQIKKSAMSSFRGRLNALVEALKDHPGIEANWLNGFHTKLSETNDVRDHFSHGLWRKNRNGKLDCIFYARFKDNDSLGVDKRTISISLARMQEIFEINLHNIAVLKELQDFLRKHASESNTPRE